MIRFRSLQKPGPIPSIAARVHYKIFKKPEDDKTKWRDYISPGIAYKYLYYNNQWFENELTDDNGVTYNERLFQHRFRSKMSLEFIWGKVYEMNQTFAFELRRRFNGNNL